MKALAILALGCGGCFVLPATTTKMEKVGVERGPSVPGHVDHVSFGASATDHAVVVHAIASGTCSRDVSAVFEVRKSEHLRMGGPDDPRAKVFGLLLAPVTIPVSAVVSAIAISGPDEITHATKIDHRESFACTNPASGLELELVLPSGAHEVATTNAQGDVNYRIPLSEPYAGKITVRSRELSREVEYHVPLPPLVAARDAMSACDAGAATLAIQTDDDGAVKQAVIAGDDGTRAACVTARLADVRFARRGTTFELPFGSERAVDTAERLIAVCAALDEQHDRLAAGERPRAKLELARILETEGMFVSDDRCDDTYTAWHERTTNSTVVHVESRAGARSTAVPVGQDVASGYRELVRLLVAKADAERATQPAPTTVASLPPADLQHEATTPADTGAAAEQPASGSPTAYARVGVGAIDSFGAGLRYRSGYAAFDVSAWVGTSNRITAAGMQGDFLLYVTPRERSSWYFGAGLGADGERWTTATGMNATAGGLSFTVAGGYERPLGSTRSFIQVDMVFPMYSLDDGTEVPPITTLSWGIGGHVSH